MKKSHIVAVCMLLLCITACNAAPNLVYFGDTLEWNKDWIKKQCGTLDIEKNIIEVSGIACSRVTPGYIWMQSDETSRYIGATDEKGAERAIKVNFSKSIRWDWEDMCGGVYEGKDYLFIGAFGDNDETDGNYSIVYFKEPAIDSANTPEITVTPQQIKYVYPDGKYILIKNHNNIVATYCWVLYWVRQDGESVADAIQRQPQPIKAYNTYEWQGEAICWLDDDTFYTTSDADDGNPPIYKFTRKWGEEIESISTEKNNRLVMIDKVLYVQSTDGLYTLDGRRAQ